MSAPLGTPTSRFQLESHDHNGNFVAALPYQNIQGEWQLNGSGQQIRCEIPYRGYKQVTQANLFPGKHELWLYDFSVSLTDPIFAGPLWTATPSSSTGVVSCSAQDSLSYLAKRLLKLNKIYTAQQPADMMIDLFNYTNGIRALNMSTNKHTSNAQTASAQYMKASGNKISDLFQSISAMGDGVEYYLRTASGVHVLHLYGGKIKPTALSLGLEYGGRLDGHSLQFNAQTIGNEFNTIGNNGLIGTASDATNQTNYNALYQVADTGTDLTAQTSLNQAAATGLKGSATTGIIPTIVTRALTPIKDFDFGTQFTIVVDDEYAQYNGLIRAVGWQTTISQGDGATVVIYTNDTVEVA